ncbi:hypothetical protein BV898_03031 [Hypsibius exemplaris]|uniref:MACPF domain-containing protein n=1 Tax=Hypsibius exemplaris TaxID=2072580 RepID=A0A1W0X6J0_HYPEX|nr:hypothetical protein BV898_03031 [Hypsibius exemplaris]
MPKVYGFIFIAGEVEELRIASGGAYVGSGYDVLRGNPYGDTTAASGIDPGLRPSKFILHKTFSTPESYCPDQATCTDLDGSSEGHTARLQLDMVDYQTSFNGSWGAGVSLSSGSILSRFLQSFGGSLSEGYNNVQHKIEFEDEVFVDNQTTKKYAEASFNYGSQGFLSAEFTSQICELPLIYSASQYLHVIRNWGTHVIVRAQIGERRISRSVYSGQNITNFLYNSNTDCVHAEANFLAFFSANIKRSTSSTLISSIKKSVTETELRIITSGSSKNPIPLTMQFESLDHFIAKRYIRQATVDSLTHLNCSILLDPISLCKVRANFQRALLEYPLTDRARRPEPIWRNYTIVKPTAPPVKALWPQGTYSIVSPSRGCPAPAGQWGTGTRYSGLDEYGSLSSGFQTVARVDAGSGIVISFCTKTGQFSGSDGVGGSWPSGSYCFFKKGSCPSGFVLGSFYNDDNDAWTPWGMIPDGSYSHTGTQYHFCCRNDGNPAIPVALPLTPFTLLPTAEKKQCQTVQGMQSTMRHINWFGENNYNNFARGIYVESSGKRWTMYFCTYEVSGFSRASSAAAVCEKPKKKIALSSDQFSGDDLLKNQLHRAIPGADFNFEKCDL